MIPGRIGEVDVGSSDDCCADIVIDVSKEVVCGVDGGGAQEVSKPGHSDIVGEKKEGGVAVQGTEAVGETRDQSGGSVEGG